MIVLACVSWGIDNNLTRKLSAADPLQIAMIKGLAAGAVNLALALAGGAPSPGFRTVAAAAAVGSSATGSACRRGSLRPASPPAWSWLKQTT